MNFIPVKYVGDNVVVLPHTAGPIKAIDGTVLPNPVILSAGMTLLMPEHEVLGYTTRPSPGGEDAVPYWGIGKTVLPEHAGESAESLAALGYEFTEGRNDFVPIASGPSTGSKKAAKAAPSETPTTQPDLPVQS